MPYLMKEYSNGGGTLQEQYFGMTLCQSRVVIVCFQAYKAWFDALKRAMDINIKDVASVSYACFVLHFGHTSGSNTAAAFSTGSVVVAKPLFYVLKYIVQHCLLLRLKFFKIISSTDNGDFTERVSLHLLQKMVESLTILLFHGK